MPVLSVKITPENGFKQVKHSSNATLTSASSDSSKDDEKTRENYHQDFQSPSPGLNGHSSFPSSPTTTTTNKIIDQNDDRDSGHYSQEDSSYHKMDQDAETSPNTATENQRTTFEENGDQIDESMSELSKSATGESESFSSAPSNPQPSRSASTGKTRARLPQETVQAFEQVFKDTHSPSADRIQMLSQKWDVEVTKVKTWFNNRKAKEKRMRVEALRHSSNAHPKPPQPIQQKPTTAAASAAPQNHARRTGQGNSQGANTQPPQPVQTQPVPPAKGMIPLNPQILDHTLVTASGLQFSIDEMPKVFSLEMFIAMRERIFVLESHLMSTRPPAVPLTTPTSATAPSLPAKRPASPEFDAFYRPKRSNNYPNTPTADVDPSSIAPSITPQTHAETPSNTQIMHRIRRRLRKDVEKTKFQVTEDVHELVLTDMMNVEDFVAVFDNKGGVVRETENGLVSVEFGSLDTVANLLGPDMMTKLHGTMFDADTRSHSVLVHVHSLAVFYDKHPGNVTMKFYCVPTTTGLRT